MEFSYSTSVLFILRPIIPGHRVQSNQIRSKSLLIRVVTGDFRPWFFVVVFFFSVHASPTFGLPQSFKMFLNHTATCQDYTNRICLHTKGKSFFKARKFLLALKMDW